MKRLLTVFGIVILGLVANSWAGPVDQSIDAILTDYFKIQSALSKDSTEGIVSAAQSIHDTAGSINATDAEIKTLVGEIQSAAREIQGQDLETARNEFFDLSRPLLVYLNKFHSNKEAYYRYFCPMAKKGWIQSEKEVKNPYYGSSMSTCGQLVE